jgi:hypothetical protein
VRRITLCLYTTVERRHDPHGGMKCSGSASGGPDRDVTRRAGARQQGPIIEPPRGPDRSTYRLQRWSRLVHGSERPHPGAQLPITESTVEGSSPAHAHTGGTADPVTSTRCCGQATSRGHLSRNP